MTSSRIKRSEGDSVSEGNVGMGEGCVGVVGGATNVPLGRIELPGTIPAPAVEVVDASVVERVVKSGGGRGRNCVCSVCAGVRVIGETESTT
jgi:hypothetical protein